MKKQKLIYAITIGGFSISLTVLILIVSFVLEEKSVDKHLSNIPNMYRVKQSGGNAQIPKCAYEPILSQAPVINFTPLFYDNWIKTMYQKEEKQAKAIQIFVAIVLILSCLGLLGLAEFLAVKRVKEIGIRKVNGAKISEIQTLLNRDFVKWVAIAFVIARPVAYYVMHLWLENVAYKTNLSWWIFALAGVLALEIALLTVSWQSWKAATRNPVEALSYERKF